MGQGFTAECRTCGCKINLMYGVGFMYPEWYSKTLKRIKAGKLGKEIKGFFKNHNDAVVSVERVILKCDSCGNLDIGDDLSVYLPNYEKAGDDIKKELSSGSFPLKEHAYSTPQELKEYYRKVMDYPHKCSKCKGGMRILNKEELEHLQCPECGGEMEDVGKVFWD